MEEEIKDEEGSESSADTEEGGKPSQEGEKTPVEVETPKPLHKDERFLEVYRGKKELERKVADLERRLGEIPQHKEPTEPSAPPEWFTEAFGENPKLWKNYQSHTQADREAIKAELKEELRKESESEKEADSAAERFLTDQLDDMEAEGMEYDRNKLVKFAYENPVVGEDGNIDLRKTLSLMNRLEPPQDTKDERKRLTATGKTAGSEPKSNEYFSDKDFEKKGWGGLR